MTTTFSKEFTGRAFAMPVQAKFFDVKDVAQALKGQIQELQAEEKARTQKEDETLSFNDAFAIAMVDTAADSISSNVTSAMMFDVTGTGVAGASTALFDVFEAVADISGAHTASADDVMNAAMTLAEERKAKQKWAKRFEMQLNAKAKEKGIALADRNTKEGVSQRRHLLEETLGDLGHASSMGMKKVEISNKGIQIPAHYTVQQSIKVKHAAMQKLAQSQAVRRAVA